MTSRLSYYSIRLTANLRAQIDSGDQGLSFGYLTVLLASIVIEIIATFYENRPIFRKFDLFWPPVTSNLTWSKNDLGIFFRTWHGLSNAVYRLSLSFLVFESSGGGRSSAPPGRAKVAQTPGRARVKRKQSQWIGMDSVTDICKYHFLCFVTIIQVKVISGHQVKKVKQLRCMFSGQIFAKNAKNDPKALFEASKSILKNPRITV